MARRDKKQKLSKEMIEELKDELKKLMGEKRREVAQRLSDAREYGDISDNAEYDVAKEEQAFVEGRIAEIEDILRRSVPAGDDSRPKGGIQSGSTVKVKVDSQEKELTIVARKVGDPLQGEISETSPLGSALLGKQAGDAVELETPAGVLTYTILAVS